MLLSCKWEMAPLTAAVLLVGCSGLCSLFAFADLFSSAVPSTWLKKLEAKAAALPGDFSLAERAMSHCLCQSMK